MLKMYNNIFLLYLLGIRETNAIIMLFSNW